VETSELQSHIHILEIPSSTGKTKHNLLVPGRCVLWERITPQDKLLLAFDAFVLAAATGHVPPFGKIIHGNAYSVVRIPVGELLKAVKAMVDKITVQQASLTPPPLQLSKHCTECEFQSRCRQLAVEKDDLSLLSGMSEKEIRKQHGKGIFSVTQLSYTFRVRRKPKRFASTPAPYSPALRALAIRERKIHMVGKVDLQRKGNSVYLDVEGVPDCDFGGVLDVDMRLLKS